jgi:hypothetical protein
LKALHGNALDERGLPMQPQASVSIEGTIGRATAFSCRLDTWETTMGRGLLLWIIGIPLPIILIVWLLGGLS